MSVATGIGVTILDIGGQLLFESSVHAAAYTGFLQMLYAKTDCEESCRIAFLYGCYQARRFGGRYIFYAPSGLVYCASPILDGKGKMTSGALAGPFILTDYDDFMDYDVKGRSPPVDLTDDDIEQLSAGARLAAPCISPRRARAVSEHLFYVTTERYSLTGLAESVSTQTDMFTSAYPVDKENELMAAISRGDIHTANAALNEMLRQILCQYGSNIEALRSRVVELTVLLSRAALKGGADINAILGHNYGYLREIDSFSTIEEIVLWLHMVARRFAGHVFDFSGAKHMDIIYRAVDYIKRKYAEKLTLKEIADHLYISQQYFCRIFKEETGQTPGGYITYVRIEESKKLLRDPAINIIDIPACVGFDNQSYFTKIFKKETGATPGRYRRASITNVVNATYAGE